MMISNLSRFVESQQELLQLIIANKAIRIQTVNLDHIRLSSENEEFEAALRSADKLAADGWPVVALVRKLGRNVRRATGSQLVSDVVSCDQLFGRRWALYGGNKRAHEDFAALLHRSGQELVCGRTDSFDAWDVNAEAVRCRAAKVDHVLVAISQPACEIFAASMHECRIGADIVGVGGAVEMATGQQKRAPRQIAAIGCEWLYRLLSDPKRLAKRYLGKDLPYFVATIVPVLVFAKTDHASDLIKMQKVISQIRQNPRYSLLALSFGDVLSYNHRPPSTARTIATQLFALILVLLPARRKFNETRWREADYLVVSSPHDERSVARGTEITSEIRARTARIIHFAEQRDFVGWTPLISEQYLHCSITAFLDLSRVILSASKKYKLNLATSLVLLRWSCVQWARMGHARRCLSIIKPRIVVTDYDRGLAAAPIVIAARKFSIPTVSLLHGDPNPISYAPPLAEHVCYWNERQREGLSTWSGAAAPRGEVVGAFWKKPRKNDIAGSSLPTALVTHTGPESLRDFLTRQEPLLTYLRTVNIVYRVRPHPLAKITKSLLSDKSSHLSFRSLAEDLRWANVVYCEASTLVVDALAFGRRVIVQGLPMQGDIALASLWRLEYANASGHPDGWREIYPPDEQDWPYALTGSESLKRTVDYVFDNVLSTSFFNVTGKGIS